MISKDILELTHLQTCITALTPTNTYMRTWAMVKTPVGHYREYLAIVYPSTIVRSLFKSWCRPLYTSVLRVSGVGLYTSFNIKPKRQIQPNVIQKVDFVSRQFLPEMLFKWKNARNEIASPPCSSGNFVRGYMREGGSRIMQLCDPCPWPRYRGNMLHNTL